MAFNATVSTRSYDSAVISIGFKFESNIFKTLWRWDTH